MRKVILLATAAWAMAFLSCGLLYAHSKDTDPYLVKFIRDVQFYIDNQPVTKEHPAWNRRDHERSEFLQKSIKDLHEDIRDEKRVETVRIRIVKLTAHLLLWELKYKTFGSDAYDDTAD